jgi:hypothetical protein
VTARAIRWAVAPVLWGRPKSVAGKWMARLELVAGCPAAAGDEALEWAGDEVLELAGDEVLELAGDEVLEPAGDAVLELAQPAATMATAETTAIARPVRVRRSRAGPPPGGCFSGGVSAVPAAW